MAILLPAFTRAARGGRESVGSADLLLECCRRMGGELLQLKYILMSDGPDSVARQPDSRVGHPLSVYEARAILREVARRGADYSLGPPPAVLPDWTAGAVRTLAEARSMSTDQGLSLVGGREVLTALLVGEGTTASALLTSSGVDRSELLSAVGRLASFQGKRPWAPAIDSLEMTGVLRMNLVFRLLQWPLNLVVRKAIGHSYGLVATLEDEAARQAGREGSADVRTEHVVLGAASIFHQLALSQIAEPEELRDCRPVLERYGLSYADLILRIVAGANAVLSQPGGEPLSVRARRPVASPDVAMAFELLGGMARQGSSYGEILESLFAMPQVRSAIAALTADQP
ncbi:hypothetical protein ACLQ29_18560 [Micromonospora sp. DT228]|uniref:hypothetical protein n=1 Tax=Micromonospora sp. DT228 TaxID=3393443 RepID=UPI003CF3E7FD